MIEAWGLQLLLGAVAAVLLMFALWLYERRHNDAGIVDVGWSAGLGLVGVWFAASSPGEPWRRTLVAALVGVWSLRLAGYLLLNRVVGKPEDGRYQALRARWGAAAHRKFFWFFQAQAVLAVLFAVPMLVAARSPRPAPDRWDALGALVWLAAVAGETTADLQLALFRSRPENRGHTCRAGWWRYSRHPNYFFEWLHWWSYVLIAVDSPAWWLTLGGPALMLLFLFRLTGIPHTERQALRSRGDDYRRYQQTTSVFVPWFPRREA